MDTKEQIIAAAAKIFARDGYEGASIREILREAGANPASAHYHFGSKDAVYRRTVERWIIPLTHERARLLDEVVAAKLPSEEAVSALIRSYISPYLQLCADVDSHPYLIMVARFTYEPPEIVQPIYDEIISETRGKYVDRLLQALPSLGLDLTQRVFGWVVNTMCSAPFDRSYVSMTGRSAVPEDPEIMIRQITRMCSAGIQALAADAETGRA